MEISEVSGENYYNAAVYFDEPEPAQEDEMFIQEEQLSEPKIREGGCYRPKPEARLLPEDFTVYTNGHIVINHPWGGPDFEPRVLPTVNHYEGPNGGYVAIYSRQKEGSSYGFDDIYVMGQVRIPGEYHGRIFVPDGYKLGDNITRDEDILEICKKYFPHLEDFWVGGDTGGWYGIQR